MASSPNAPEPARETVKWVVAEHSIRIGANISDAEHDFPITFLDFSYSLIQCSKLTVNWTVEVGLRSPTLNRIAVSADQPRSQQTGR